MDLDHKHRLGCTNHYIVRPTLEYAAQALSYKHYYFTERKSVIVGEASDMIRKFEIFQSRTLKKLVSSPKSTPPAVVRILTRTMSNPRE